MFLKGDGFKIQVQRRKERHESKREVRFLQILPARFVTDFVCGMAKGGLEEDPQVLFQYFILRHWSATLLKQAWTIRASLNKVCRMYVFMTVTDLGTRSNDFSHAGQ